MAQPVPNKSGSGKKVANSVVAVSSAAVLAVYAAGYVRTQSAADRFEGQSEERRPAAEHAAAVAETPKLIATTDAPTTRKPASVESKQPAPPKAETPLPNVQPEPTTPIAEQRVEASAVVAPVVAPVVPAVVAATPDTPKPPAPAPVWKDGTYTGWGTSRHGDIQSSVVIEGGRIKSATIAQCLTRYSCSVIEQLPPEVAQRQSPEIDFVSGATQSTNAFYYGVVEALSKAK